MDYSKNDERGRSSKDLFIHDILMQLPSDLFENKENFLNFFSIETWNNLIPEDIKEHLLQFLPAFAIEDETEKQKTLSMLFGGDNFHFGNPLERFRDEVNQGSFNPESSEIKNLVLSAKKREYHNRIERLQFATAQKCLNSRKKHLEAITGNIVTVPKIERKRGSKANSMKDKIAKRYCEEILRIRGEVGDEEYSSDEDDQTIRGINGGAHWKKGTVTDRVKIDTNTNTDCVTALMQETHNCFFSLLRDLFMQQSNSSLTEVQLKHRVEMWQRSPIAALNPWYNQATENSGWKDLTSSAVTFLSGRGTCKEYTGLPLTPILEWIESIGHYKFHSSDSVSDEQLFDMNEWWLQQVDQANDNITGIMNFQDSFTATFR